MTAKTYLLIWGWLSGLMLLGVVLSELPMPKATIVLLVLALSSVKALLVSLYYMHLKFDRRLLALILLAPVALVACALAVVFSSRLIHL
jgi:cytochrome c oxidase subunit 4